VPGGPPIRTLPRMAHLLIVDNDERIVELTQWFLARSGHRVDTALSYAAARVLIRADAPELMLADLDLGEENGREELPRLAKEGILPRTIVVSGFLDAELERELRLVPGVFSTLTKPVDLSALERHIAEALEADVLIPAPGPPATIEVTAENGEDEEDDGWVEIVQLRADVAPVDEHGGSN
jgi:DNA-binding NtrC family response regulator